MDQGQREYPPGTVGYLAKGRGWDTTPPTSNGTSHNGTEWLPEADQPSEQDAAGDTAQPTSNGTAVADVDPDVDREAASNTDRLPTGAGCAESTVPTNGHVTVPAQVRTRTEPSPPVSDPADLDDELDLGLEPEPRTEPQRVAGGDRRPAPASWPEHRPPARWVEPGAVAAEEAQRARVDGELAGHHEDLSSARLLRRQTKAPPRSGWRHVLFILSGGLINLGQGPDDQRRHELTVRVNQPLYGCHRIAMLSLKGGVGKTTVTATLGATFASLRGDRVIAVDANPDRGTLSQKIPLETTATVRHLLRDAQRIRRYTDVRAYTSQGPSRLEVLASEQDPAVSEAFSEEEYRRTVALLEHFYNIVLTDCGTGLMHSAMYGVLGLADSLVIVSSGSIDGARSASATMDWLDAHGHGELVANSVAVINSVRRGSGHVDLNQVAEHFAARCRAVIRIPYDSHLEEGAELDLDRVSPATRVALLELAAAVADAFTDEG